MSTPVPFSANLSEHKSTKIDAMLAKATENTIPVLPAGQPPAAALFARNPAEYAVADLAAPGTGPAVGMVRVRLDHEAVPALVGLEVRQYKNLRDVWLPWSDGLALFGVNGAGKTNLLECLALLLGTTQTLALAGPRLGRVESDALAVLVRTGPAVLPWPPEVVMSWGQHQPDHPELQASMPAFSRAIADGVWWHRLGATGGVDFAGGMAAARIPGHVVDYLDGLTVHPVIRHSLTQIHHRQSSPEYPSPGVARMFDRTLMAPYLPDKIAASAARLPDLFAPLQSHLSWPDQ
ncbi:MAG TPA: hypothetical protein VFP89_11295 [Propionibacteriaceae bacterium]|nr:hypothetical protein [Propionibacteriaceae bacterium]